MCKCKYPKWLKANSAFSNLMTVFLRRKKTQKAEKTEKKKKEKNRETSFPVVALR